MLTLAKNEAVTKVAKQQIEVRQLEVDWYCGNYATLTGQAAMLAGFAFGQLTTPIPENHPPPYMVEWFYLFLTCCTIGLELSVVLICTSLTVWGPGLALRGPHGTADLHRAVDTLRDYQSLVFVYFIAGWFLFFISAILQVWIYFKHRVAIVVTIPFVIYTFLILFYSCELTMKMRISNVAAVSGRMQALTAYEAIGDLDHGLHEGTANGARDIDGYCPVHAADTQYDPMAMRG